MIYFLMYLLTIVDNLKGVLGIISILLGICAIVSTIIIISFYVNKDMEEAQCFLPWYKRVLGIFTLLTSLLVFTPCSKGIAFIYIAPQIIENGAVKDTVKNIPELTKRGTEYLKELLKDKVEGVKNDTARH